MIFYKDVLDKCPLISSTVNGQKRNLFSARHLSMFYPHIKAVANNGFVDEPELRRALSEYNKLLKGANREPQASSGLRV